MTIIKHGDAYLVVRNTSNHLVSVPCNKSGGFEMEFSPVFDNYTETRMLFVNNHCHQVFGRFNGIAILDDGNVIEVKDLRAFAEHAVNRW